MEDFIVVRDTRERKPYSFDGYPVEVADAKLDTGDYSIYGYEDAFAVERKTKSDFLRSITQRRDNFQDEVKRASDFRKPLYIVIECPYKEFRYGDYYNDIPVSSVTGTIDTWGEAYNAVFEFFNDRKGAAEFTYKKLTEWVYEESVAP
jgi:hypothetical protein